jgi:hypothetical protein
MLGLLESSKVAETSEDFISGKFCECKHLLSDHEFGKCYAFSSNGTVWSSCLCSNAKPLTFQFRVSINENAQTSTT